MTRGISLLVDGFFISKGYCTSSYHSLDLTISSRLTVENYPTRPQIFTLGELMELSWIFVGDLHSVVSSKHTHLYVGGLKLMLLPLPCIQDISAAVSASKLDHTPLQYY
jgi:hypothetical protein